MREDKEQQPPSRLLEIAGADLLEPPRPCEAFVVGNRSYLHSAARFWPRLVDESIQVCPFLSHIQLVTLTAERINPLRLDPTQELADDIESLLGTDLEAVIQSTIAELEIMGPPTPVRVTLEEGPNEVYAGHLALDCVDAETMIYLTAWLLEWAKIPHEIWHRDDIDGQFVGRVRPGETAYLLSFEFRNRHLSEGLYRHTLSVRPNVARD